MADLTPELAPQVIEASTTNAEEAAGAIGRAFDCECVLKAGDSKPHTESPDESFAGGGLVFAFKFGEESMLATLTAGQGLVPDWTKSPDPTGESKLSTLGQELSMLLVPDTLMADAFECSWVDDLAAAVERSEPAGDATSVAIEVAQGESLSQMSLVWPVANVDAAAQAGAQETADTEPAPSDNSPESAENDSAPAADEPAKPRSRVLLMGDPPPRDYRDLPPSVRTALRVEVPVSVNLASKKVALEEVVELGPGSIITFDKSCEDAIEVTVGDTPVATAEAVKVGERFGVRVQSIILPAEHFRPMLPPEVTS